ncbi:MAG: hypothetical protein U5L09_07200 [Bacteroidales bacterium]|nr:hypothetical protein [Bacteroidales bacterium]
MVQTTGGCTDSICQFGRSKAGARGVVYRWRRTARQGGQVRFDDSSASEQQRGGGMAVGRSEEGYTSDPAEPGVYL